MWTRFVLCVVAVLLTSCAETDRQYCQTHNVFCACWGNKCSGLDRSHTNAQLSALERQRQQQEQDRRDSIHAQPALARTTTTQQPPTWQQYWQQQHEQQQQEQQQQEQQQQREEQEAARQSDIRQQEAERFRIQQERQAEIKDDPLERELSQNDENLEKQREQRLACDAFITSHCKPVVSCSMHQWCGVHGGVYMCWDEKECGETGKQTCSGLPPLNCNITSGGSYTGDGGVLDALNRANKIHDLNKKAPTGHYNTLQDN